MDAVWPLLQAAGWFADCDPQSKTPVRVTLDGGQDSSIRSAAPEIVRSIQEINQDVFPCDSFSVTDDDEMLLKPPVIDELWGGPAQHRATFRGTLAEWSLDGLGWLTAFLAHMSSEHGVSTPLMLTASRSDESNSRAE